MCSYSYLFAAALAEWIKNAKNLKNFCCDNSCFGCNKQDGGRDAGITLAEAFGQDGQRSLWRGYISIREGIKSNQSLKVIGLEFHGTSREGIVSLGPALIINETITKVCINQGFESCDTTRKGIKDLCMYVNYRTPQVTFPKYLSYVEKKFVFSYRIHKYYCICYNLKKDFKSNDKQTLYCLFSVKYFYFSLFVCII